MSVCISTEVSVDIDLADHIDDFTDSDLRELGLCKVGGIDPTLPITNDKCWRQVAWAIRDGDQRTLLDLLSRMAWAQANVVIPVVDLKPLH